MRARVKRHMTERASGFVTTAICKSPHRRLSGYRRPGPNILSTVHASLRTGCRPFATHMRKTPNLVSSLGA